MRLLLFSILSCVVLLGFRGFLVGPGISEGFSFFIADSFAVEKPPAEGVTPSPAPGEKSDSVVDTSVDILSTSSAEATDAALKEELKHLSETELSVLLDLAKRDRRLEDRAKLLHESERVISASRSYIESRIKELRDLQLKVESVLDEYKREEDVKIRALVKIYENMKPQEAAQIFENLEMKTLLEVVERMREVKVAPILARMRPERAREVTVRLLKAGEGMMSYNNVCSCEVLRIKGAGSNPNVAR